VLATQTKGARMTPHPVPNLAQHGDRPSVLRAVDHAKGEGPMRRDDVGAQHDDAMREADE
jgi:hypothetical protein